MRHELGSGGLLSSRREILWRHSLLVVVSIDAMVDPSVLRRGRPTDAVTSNTQPNVKSGQDRTRIGTLNLECDLSLDTKCVRHFSHETAIFHHSMSYANLTTRSLSMLPHPRMWHKPNSIH